MALQDLLDTTIEPPAVGRSGQGRFRSRRSAGRLAAVLLLQTRVKTHLVARSVATKWQTIKRPLLTHCHNRPEPVERSGRRITIWDLIGAVLFCVSYQLAPLGRRSFMEILAESFEG